MEIEMDTDQPAMTFDDAERLYGEIMGYVADIIGELDADVQDERVNKLYEMLDLAVRDIYSFATPPKR